MPPAVVVKHVDVRFASTFKALDDVSLALPSGKMIGFIGPSGAGKTTLIRAIVGRQKLTKGSIEVMGMNAGAAKHRSRLSYMTQENSVYPDLTTLQNLQYFATMFGIKKKDMIAEIDGILEVVDMHEQADQLVGSLSGGQKQRVSLAVSLIGKPELMVLDEPTVGLDPVLRDEIWKMFRNLAEQGKTLIISSHVMDEAERCDELVLIRDGKVLAQGSPQGLCEQTGARTVEQSFLKLVGEQT